jgi:hypothetical protein
VAALLLAACTRINQENFSKIETGMTEHQVLSISGTASRWVGRDAEINVRFVGGKVATKTYDSPPLNQNQK